MATPPSSPPPYPPPPYPPPPPIVASQLPSTLKWTRKATRLRSLATRAPGADKPMVHIDPTTGKANGPHNKKLRTYLGIVARDKVDVTYETWKQVPAAHKDLIWEDIRAEFDIPKASDGRTKKKILKTMGEWWRQFKSDLTSKWALAADKDSVDDTDVQKKAQAIHKQNTAPHVLSRRGYEYLEQKLMAEKIKKKLEEAAQSGCTKVVIDPPSRIRRHVKWKMVRTKKTGKMTSEVTKEIAEKIDLLTATIGRPEHPGHVRAAGAEELITKKVTRQRMLSFNQMQSQFQSQMQSQGLALPPEPELLVSAQRGVVLIPKRQIQTRVTQTNAGRVYEGSTVVHNIPLLHGQVKVVVSLAKPADRPDPESLQVMWDTSLFGLFNLDFPLYIKHEDLSEIAHCGQCLSISVIQLWIMHLTKTSMRAENSYVYGFLEPQSIQRSGQSQFESESYMKSWMQNLKRDVYLGAYLNGPDNYLKGIINRSVLFSNTFALALLNNINILMFLVFNSALKGLDDTPQPKSKAGARWIVVKCNRQKGSTECGYYMMHWMSTIILGSFRNNWKTYFNDVRPLEVERLKALRI
ncbi:hypothetical protein HKD37_10G027678 [Glycine soja]